MVTLMQHDHGGPPTESRDLSEHREARASTTSIQQERSDASNINQMGLISECSKDENVQKRGRTK
jgi:hypothetical protein